MTTRQWFRQTMAERRGFSHGTAEHEWRTRACRKYVWIMRGVPVAEWKE